MNTMQQMQARIKELAELSGSGLAFYFIFLLCLSVISYFLFSFFYKEMAKAFPAMNISYTTDTEIMNFYVEGKGGRTDFKIPKAYFYWKLNELKNGKLNAVRVYVSLSENMKPWSLSKDFGNKKSHDDTEISIGAGSAIFPNKTKGIPLIIERWSKNYKGIYLDMFEKYDRDIIKGHDSPLDFFLIPIEQPELPIYLKCPNIGNPESTNCRVKGDFSNKLIYSFSMPLKKIEEVHAINSKVRELIESFIVK